MNWHIVVRPEVERYVTKAAVWYDSQQPGLGTKFREEVIHVFDALAQNPLLNCRRQPQLL